MKDKNIKILSIFDYFVTWIIIPLFLFILWIYLSFNYVYHLQAGLTVLEHKYKFTTNIQDLSGRKSVTSIFKAKENNMGIVSIHFESSSRGNVIFRIKEQLSSEWYYEANLDAYVFARDPSFTFGFPPIKESKGKIYTFELLSKEGPLSDYVNFDKSSRVYLVKFQQPKTEITDSSPHTINFIIKKILNLFQDIKFTLHIISYAIPLFLYIVMATMLSGIRFNTKKKNAGAPLKYIHFSRYLNLLVSLRQFFKSRYYKNFKFKSTVMLLFFITLSIFYLNVFINEVFTVLVLFWIINAYINRVPSKISASTGIMFLILTSISLLVNTQIADKASAWAYIMLFTSLLQELMFERKT